jgi:hypothetical protein
LKILNQKNSKNFKPNGIENNGQNESLFFTKKKEIDFKKKFYIRFFLSLLTTNLLTYQLVKEVPKETSNESHGFIEKDHYLIKIPLSVGFPTNGHNTKATIISESNVVVTKEAVIVKVLKESQFNTEESSPLYLVSIPKQDLPRFVDFKNKKLYAFPVNKLLDNKRSPHEIIF